MHSDEVLNGPIKALGERARDTFGPNMIAGRIIADGQFAPKNYYYIGEIIRGKPPFAGKMIWGTGPTPDAALEAAKRRIERNIYFPRETIQ